MWKRMAIHNKAVSTPYDELINNKLIFKESVFQYKLKKYRMNTVTKSLHLCMH
jgi:hypothetical protein